MKVIKLKEADLVRIIKRVIKEQETPKQYACQVVSEKSTNIKDLPQLLKIWGSYENINNELNTRSQQYMSKLGENSVRAACEIALIQIRPNYKDKNLFVIDGLNNFIYLFDKDSKFVASGPIIKGSTKQSNDAKEIAKALITYKQIVEKLKTQGKTPSFENFLNYIKTNKIAFFPSGIYQSVGKLVDKPDMFGSKQNLLPLQTLDGSKLTQAIHGYVTNKERTTIMSTAEKLVNSSNNTQLSKEFITAINKDLNMNLSYGCINVTANFLPFLQKYGPNSYVFVLSDTEDNYLAQNGMNYFNNALTSPQCLSPEKLGASPISNSLLAENKLSKNEFNLDLYIERMVGVFDYATFDYCTYNWGVRRKHRGELTMGGDVVFSISVKKNKVEVSEDLVNTIAHGLNVDSESAKSFLKHWFRKNYLLEERQKKQIHIRIFDSLKYFMNKINEHLNNVGNVHLSDLGKYMHENATYMLGTNLIDKAANGETITEEDINIRTSEIYEELLNITRS